MWIRYMSLTNPQITYRPIPDYGRVFTIGEWIYNVEDGWLIDDDGYGKFATKTEMSNIMVCPSDIQRQDKIDWFNQFTHIVWFNR